MTDRPYTDEDLRAEAARQLANAVEDPDFMGIGEQMEGHKIPSRGDFQWDQLGDADFDKAMHAIDDLIAKVADVSEWAINLGADGLEPVRHRVHINDKAGAHRVRLHFAFAPDMDEDTRRAVIARVGEVIADHS